MVYEEVKDDIEPFLKLYRLSKAAGMSARHVINLLEIENTNLPDIKERFKRLRNEINMLQFRKHTCERNLYQLNDQIATTTKLLNSFRISFKRERMEIENLHNEKVRLEAIVTEFKNNNEDYLKIKQIAEENVKNVLNDGKILLKFATLSVIESLRSNSEEYSFVLYNIANSNATSYSSNSLSLMLPGRQQHQ